MSESSAVPPGETAQGRRRRLSLELVIVILLGIASVATAYASFQSSLYDSRMAAAYTRGQNAQTEAESLYLEANQQYVQDAQTFQEIVTLGVEAESADPEVAAEAAAKMERLYFVAVDDVFAAAIDWSNAENDANPDVYTDPQSSEDYLDARYAAYEERSEAASALIQEGDLANRYGDQLTLYTVLLAIALFLLGIAAVVSARLIKWVLVGIGSALTLFAIIVTTLVPFVAVE